MHGEHVQEVGRDTQEAGLAAGLMGSSGALRRTRRRSGWFGGGGHVHYEQKFISESRVYVTWDDLAVDLSKLSDREAA